MHGTKSDEKSAQFQSFVGKTGICSIVDDPTETSQIAQWDIPQQTYPETKGRIKLKSILLFLLIKVLTISLFTKQ